MAANLNIIALKLLMHILLSSRTFASANWNKNVGVFNLARLNSQKLQDYLKFCDLNKRNLTTLSQDPVIPLVSTKLELFQISYQFFDSLNFFAV